MKILKQWFREAWVTPVSNQPCWPCHSFLKDTSWDQSSLETENGKVLSSNSNLGIVVGFFSFFFSQNEENTN